MAFNRNDYTPKLEGNVLKINNKPSLKAADTRGQVILENVEKMLKNQIYQRVALSYEESTSSWVDAKYKHVLFLLDADTARPVMAEYASSGDKPKSRTLHLPGLDYALATDGNVIITTNEGNLMNASESKRKTTTVKGKKPEPTPGGVSGISCTGATDIASFLLAVKEGVDMLAEVQPIVEGGKITTDAGVFTMMDMAAHGLNGEVQVIPAENFNLKDGVPDGYVLSPFAFKVQHIKAKNFRMVFDLTAKNSGNKVLLLPGDENASYSQTEDKRILNVCLAPFSGKLEGNDPSQFSCAGATNVWNWETSYGTGALEVDGMLFDVNIDAQQGLVDYINNHPQLSTILNMTKRLDTNRYEMRNLDTESFHRIRLKWKTSGQNSRGAIGSSDGKFGNPTSFSEQVDGVWYDAVCLAPAAA